jgi:hypothetical protein
VGPSELMMLLVIFGILVSPIVLIVWLITREKEKDNA